MGDDTWLSVFPKTFEENMTFPFDSFNVEDLHTVDNGVVSHLFPLLSTPSPEFDFLIGHFLGVDHVGHRVGPNHPSMHAKLTQMNQVLQRVVDLLPTDTLLVVLGDHGMDASGDHGGDGILETSAGVWMYSSGASLRYPTPSASGSPNSVLSSGGGLGKIPGGLLEYATFPEATKAFRRIQQIDLVPTLSLLLGLPIPFNNLGSIIPELFFRPAPSRSSPHPHSNLKDTTLEKALRKNAEQIMTYLETYRASASGGELDESWKEVVDLYKLIGSEEFRKRKEESRLVGLMNFNRFALGVCRRMWAQFDAGLMGMGLVLLGMTLCESWGMYTGLKAFASGKGSWKPWARQRAQWMGGAGLIGGLLGAFASSAVGYGWVHLSIFGGTLLASMAGIMHSPPALLSLSSLSFKTLTPIVILVVHSLCFFSNSFTFWEDRIVSFLSISSIVPYALAGFTSPILRLRKRILGFSLLYAVCVRLIGWSSVCREEQQPWCDVTFYTSESGSAAPRLAIYLAVPSVFLLAYGVKRVLGTTKSEGGIAGFTKGYVVMPAMLAGSVAWLLEYYSLVGEGGGGWEAMVRVWRTWLARGSLSLLILLGIPLWFMHPVSLTIQLSDRPQDQAPTQGGKGAKKQVTVLGYANAFGSPLFAFWFIWVGVVWVCTQLMGQVVLVLGCVALMSWLEVLDGVKDSEAVEKAFSVGRPPLPSSSTNGEYPSTNGQDATRTDGGEEEDFSPPFTFGWTLPLCLLGLQMFFGTGHQGTISSIQWKSAFLVSGEVIYPWSVLTVLINSVGMVGVFVGLASGLVVVWCVLPRNEGRGDSSKASTSTTSSTTTTTTTKTQTETQTLPTPLLLLPSLSVHIYFHTLLLASSAASAILRRHLMVWKVFAPRFMLGVVLMGVVDLGAVLGLAGVWRVRRVVRGVLRGMR